MSDITHPVTVPYDEAFLEIPDADTVEGRFEARPNTGITHVYDYDREELLALMRRTVIFRSGADGRAMHFGLYICVDHRVYGLGQLFIKTLA